ncbi:fucolectin-6-like [Octopus sinensis]|uniref:Fucolectin-6-like n=1 Tax=Octopus sinensis TaxID=2607531 RepID=A0A7E6F1B8_9MOLL|nr:fucolectin-6-like [Octopus sinensis]
MTEASLTRSSAGNNIAQGKPVQQSSVAYKHGAQLAIDGKTNGIEPCSQTNYMKDPWWIVDLGVAHKIDLVTVYLDGSYEFSKDYKVFAFRATYLNTNSECSGVSEKARGSIYSVKCAAIARYVMIQRVSDFSSYLHICEVQVTGIAVGNANQGKYCKSTRTKMIQSFTSCTVRSQLECAIFCHSRNFCSTFSIRPSKYGKFQCILYKVPASNNRLDKAEKELIYNEC